MEENDLIKEVAAPLYENKGWIKFLGVFSIIIGIPTLIVLVGILSIWIGITLVKAANQYELAYENGDKMGMIAANAGIAKYFKIIAILTLIGIIIDVVMLILMFAGAFPMNMPH